MIANFNEAPTAEFEADICIVGSGATGLSCAVEFLSTGLRVLVLEGGLRVLDEGAKDIHRAGLDGLLHKGIHEARERIVGGTTTTWGGQALPFMKEDFAYRPWMQNSGWPFGRAELEPFYDRASHTLGIDAAVPFDVRPWKGAGIPEPVFEPDSLELFVTKWCRQPNFALRHGSAIAASETTTLLYNANAVELVLDEPGGHVREVVIRSLSGRNGTVRAKQVILAGGCVETARLLLASRRQMPEGVGNGYDLVGRYFQDHTASIVGLMLPNVREEFHDVFDPFYLRGYKYFPRLRLSPAWARKREVLHASIQIVIPPDADEAIDASKALVRALKTRRFDNDAVLAAQRVARRPLDLFRAAWRLAVKHRGISSRRSPVWLECQSEQEPDPASRVRLDETETDKLGMPRVRLDWRVSEKTYETIREATILAAAQFSRSGLGIVVVDDWITTMSEDWRGQIGDVYHQCGTTRMGASETSGVVDADCHVYGVRNLSVASAAVFPTSSFSNPTMTAIALSIRLCDRIKSRMGIQWAR
jgi:choline dehydrogenase-like flavoprotein